MEKEKESNKEIFGLVVITIILVIGAIYIWRSEYKMMKSYSAVENQTETNTSTN